MTEYDTLISSLSPDRTRLFKDISQHPKAANMISVRQSSKLNTRVGRSAGVTARLVVARAQARVSILSFLVSFDLISGIFL